MKQLFRTVGAIIALIIISSIVTPPQNKEVVFENSSGTPDQLSASNADNEKSFATTSRTTKETTSPSSSPSRTIPSKQQNATSTIQKTITPAVLPVKIPETTLYQKGLGATVNLICKLNETESIVATGSIIDSAGYILSNAHVAKDLPNPTCLIRRGSPAVTFDHASLVFVPNIYKTATSEELAARNDISIWKLDSIPSVNPWQLETATPPRVNDVELTLSYPAELLGADNILKDLNLVFSSTRILALDQSIIRSTANIGAQRGSSGGILIDPYTGFIHGIIFAVETKEHTTDRQIFSITAPAINTILIKEKGETLAEYLASSPQPIN